MPSYGSIVVLTGAGISAESGVATFRDKGGVWSKVDYRDVATPEGFARNPDLVHQFYNARRVAARSVKPNAAHFALARLEREHEGEFTLTTQNVDGLHEASDSQLIIHMHGELASALCNFCNARFRSEEDLSVSTPCPSCARAGGMRPDVVWFGEMPYHMERIGSLLSSADVFISIGTSGSVYPAAGFVAEARAAGAHTVELNLEPSDGASQFAETHYGRATDVVPAYVERLLSGATR